MARVNGTGPAALFASARAFARLARTPFLAGGAAYHAVGLAAATMAGHRADLRVALWTQVAITAAQLVTHFSNEYFDLEADRANRVVSPWSGGSRVLVEGRLAPAVALRAAGVCAAAAMAAGWMLGRHTTADPATVPLVVLALGVAWSYSAPPARLHARGLGEISGALLLAGLTPLVGYVAQAGWPSPGTVAAVVPLVGLQLAMLITVSLPDVEGDRAAGKRTLAVRVGTRRAARSAAVLTLAALALPLAGLGRDFPAPAVWAVSGWLPIGAAQAARLWRLGPRPDWSALGFWGIGLAMGPAATLAATWTWFARAA